MFREDLFKPGKKTKPAITAALINFFYLNKHERKSNAGYSSQLYRPAIFCFIHFGFPAGNLTGWFSIATSQFTINHLPTAKVSSRWVNTVQHLSARARCFPQELVGNETKS